MYFSNFLYMRDEVSLLLVMLFLLMYDLIAGEKGMKYFQPIAIAVFTIHTLFNLRPYAAGESFGGMYQYAPMMTIVKSILNVGTLVVFLQAKYWFDTENQRNKRGEFYFLTLTTLLGMYFMISAGNFLLFYIGLEMASIPLATLAALDKYKQKSAEAGAKYILTAAFSSGILLFGLSLVYGTCGTLYFADIPAMVQVNPLQIMAFVFFAVGLFFKISLVPFHLWAADVYEGAPTNVTSYLSVISKGSAAFVLMVIFYKVFGSMIKEWQGILYGVIIASITLGNLFALRQKNLKRFLAFSSISQAGYIMLGVIGGTPMGMTSLVYYILVYLFSNLAAFGVISAIEARTGKINIPDYNGLYSTNPKLSFVMMLALFSLAGIPPFAGFFSKFFIFAAAAQQGYYMLVLVALINTIISLYYYLIVVRAMFIEKSDAPIATFTTDGYNKASLIFCTAGIILIGLLSVIYQHIDGLSFGM
ncbi:NADH-quinone oxidoreductase subunit N [uncultured Paludibacter sp.]|uniref:NADH-quinone oxidoreductase subunit N n=1 Tax=uncultured Paludibacter sp. TaxID=497635 RepID=A0A653AJT3_9BACT|nr:NADH-quinone oxidoreductase subunit N [uncultured Paludibacter sp.]